MRKRINFWALTVIIVLSVGLVNCQKDWDCSYIANINNLTNYDMIVCFPNDSIIICPQNKEKTIIEGYYGTGVSAKGGYSLLPIFRDNIVKIFIVEENKILVKDISDDNNWNYNVDKYKNGKYYSRITTVFVINDEDIKEVEQ